MRANGGNRKKGAALIVAVVSMILAAALGAAVLSVATSSRYERVNLGITSRAYYLAESGATYVRVQRLANPGSIPGGTFTLANGDQFTVVVGLTNVVTGVKTAQHVLVESTGIANPGTALEAQQQVHFDIYERGLSSNALPVGFDFDNDGKFDTNLWTAVNVDATIISGTGPSDHETALDLKGDEGQINLRWANTNYPALDLTRAWAKTGGLLSYDAQTKFNAFDTDSQEGFGLDYLLGISFRVRDTNHFYGLSYFRSIPDSPKDAPPVWVTNLLKTAQLQQNLRGSNIFIVLWYRNGDDMQLLKYLTLGTNSPYPGIMAAGAKRNYLEDYSTLLLQLDEKYVGATTNRENRIVAYAQSRSVYTNWLGGSNVYARWQEHTNIFPAPLVWDDGTTVVTNSQFTSAGFDTNRPEVGIHVYYDQSGAGKKFFDDFALRVEGLGVSYGGTQIQY